MAYRHWSFNGELFSNRTNIQECFRHDCFRGFVVGSGARCSTSLLFCKGQLSCSWRGKKKTFSQRLVGQYQTGQVGHPVSLKWNGSTEQLATLNGVLKGSGEEEDRQTEAPLSAYYSIVCCPGEAKEPAEAEGGQECKGRPKRKGGGRGGKEKLGEESPSDHCLAPQVRTGNCVCGTGSVPKEPGQGY